MLVSLVISFYSGMIHTRFCAAQVTVWRKTETGIWPSVLTHIDCNPACCCKHCFKFCCCGLLVVACLCPGTCDPSCLMSSFQIHPDCSCFYCSSWKCLYLMRKLAEASTIRCYAGSWESSVCSWNIKASNTNASRRVECFRTSV